MGGLLGGGGGGGKGYVGPPSQITGGGLPPPPPPPPPPLPTPMLVSELKLFKVMYSLQGGQGGRHFDVMCPRASTSFRRHAPTRFLINQFRIITFPILKSDNIENSRIELKGIVLQVRSNQIKVTFIIILPSNLVYFVIFSFSHRN